MFGSAVTRIDFNRIDSVKLILAASKVEPNIHIYKLFWARMLQVSLSVAG
jgi:hypothetical protein